MKLGGDCLLPSTPTNRYHLLALYLIHTNLPECQIRVCILSDHSIALDAADHSYFPKSLPLVSTSILPCFSSYFVNNAIWRHLLCQSLPCLPTTSSFFLCRSSWEISSTPMGLTMMPLYKHSSLLNSF